eukprot:CAMPEP_0175052190 /NCGR_PEP_ID=MMETSP0052_2-20121109/8223_1 /TAXON_ID=51329 ORGANISM="Polytomella parva, Strain SAG 63-3" /NCGR_SAMPLE_ID=MMETSP0052_2 /ASSEMBLY_ACC=CAM_ASM_000194 /LENGTH=550 /DNA_ID=CAMNT_0016316569 /DNA_START=148 /DNA_END=1800 /DNA_ORIENTATION=+
MSVAMAAGSRLQLHGERQSGQDVRTQNVTAVSAVANIVKSSLGPVGLDKMLVDDIGDVTVTNDGATILKLLEIEHPAAKILVELAELQDAEVGDGTTSVVILAAEFLKRANELVRNKLHPTNIINGFRQAMRESCKFINRELAISTENIDNESLLNAAKTSMSSKIVGVEGDFFAQLVVDSIRAVKSVDEITERVRYPVKAVSVLKAHGKSARESRLLDGYALNLSRAAQGMPRRVVNAKIACLDMNLQKARLMMGVQVLVTDPAELEKIRARELDITKERIQKILASGANVVLTTKGIDDMALKYFVEAGVLAIRRVEKDDLKRIARATGATIVVTLADMEGNETFDPACLGTAAEVLEERISDDSITMIRGCESTKAVTLLLRGANDYMLDEMDRSIHDSLCVVKRVLESNSVVPGGGCVETALSVHLESFASNLGSKEQLAIREFANALLVLPKTLAVNAAKDATELVAALRSAHYQAQNDATGESKDLAHQGLDLIQGKIRDNFKAGVLEPSLSKTKMIQFATEAAITILRIDDLIRLDPNPEAEQ